jgi:hypothetical protein
MLIGLGVLVVLAAVVLLALWPAGLFTVVSSEARRALLEHRKQEALREIREEGEHTRARIRRAGRRW